jgi:HlyD family secretion protein
MINRFFIIFFLFLSGMGCSHSGKNSDPEKDEIITVAARSLAANLFYAGTIQPLKSIVITSPAEGVVADVAFHYGDVVKAQQLLFIISSSKFQTDYKNALMQYIKAKTDYTNGESQLKASEFLYKNQLISADELKSKKTNYFTQQLSLVQAKDTLATLLKQLDMKAFNFETLTIADIDKITQLLQQQDSSQKIHIISPAAGVILLSTKEDSDIAIKINKGSQVKQGDVLAVIGDVSGLMIYINVNEFNVNQLKIGQKVTVTGAAFSQFVLSGKIAGVDHQGQTIQGGSPVFPVEVIVPHLTSEQQAAIRIGMSAKVEIAMAGAPVLAVPIAVVYEKEGLTYAKKQEKSGKIVEVRVQTGQTTADAVVIESGLKVGDKVVVSH